jgi:hypothetical protein
MIIWTDCDMTLGGNQTKNGTQYFPCLEHNSKVDLEVT